MLPFRVFGKILDCYIEGMDAYIFQHVKFEGPGAILPYLESRNFQVRLVKLYAGDAIPSPSSVDFAVLMGGPMSALDEDEYPYLALEKRFCREMFALKKPLLGICLGAQIMANAFGAAIRKNPEKEIGWFPVTFENGLSVEAFHWHGETFDIPDLASPFAYSAACRNQGFCLGRTVGLQFHLETTRESMCAILENCSDELEEALAHCSASVQTEREIVDRGTSLIPQANGVLADLLDAILER